jgi:hypothetical protein
MPRVVLALASLAVFGAVVFLDVPGDRGYSSALQNWAHAPAFGIIALVILYLQPGRQFDRLRPYALAAAGAILLGIGTEFLQRLIGRDAELGDALQDIFGVFAALSLHALIVRRQPVLPPIQRRLIVRVALISSLLTLAPIVECAAAYWHRHQAFPVLADFRSDFDLYFIRQTQPPLKRTLLPASLGSAAGEAALYSPYGSGNTWPGVVIEEPYANWSGYRTLAVEVANPNASDLTLQLTVHDREYDGRPEDRFDRVFVVPPHQRLVVRASLDEIARGPRERTMDLQRLWRIAIAQQHRSHLPGFFLKRVWLE